MPGMRKATQLRAGMVILDPADGASPVTILRFGIPVPNSTLRPMEVRRFDGGGHWRQLDLDTEVEVLEP